MSYYADLSEFPLVNWEKCQEGDLTKTRKDDIDVSPEMDMQVWESFNFEHMEKFGISRKMQKTLQLQKRLAMLELELFETGKVFLKNQIRRIKEELEQNNKEDKGGMTIDASLIYLSKFMGFKLVKSTLMTLEYLTMREEYGKANK